jgi:hypothetical protein
MTLFAPSYRDATLTRVLDLLEADPRIEAAVITGSMGAQTADRWSDIDVATLVANAQDCERVADDWIARLYRELPVAHHYRTTFGTTIVRGFLLRNGLEVDLAFTPAGEFTVWAPVRVAFDRTGTAIRAAASPAPWSPTPDWPGEAGFAWHDVLHACVAANAANRGRHSSTCSGCGPGRSAWRPSGTVGTPTSSRASTNSQPRNGTRYWPAWSVRSNTRRCCGDRGLYARLPGRASAW